LLTAGQQQQQQQQQHSGHETAMQNLLIMINWIFLVVATLFLFSFFLHNRKQLFSSFQHSTREAATTAL